MANGNGGNGNGLWMKAAVALLALVVSIVGTVYMTDRAENRQAQAEAVQRIEKKLDSALDRWEVDHDSLVKLDARVDEHGRRIDRLEAVR